jgi:subtilisin family serine protease
MTDPGSNRPFSSAFSWIRRLFRPDRPPVGRPDPNREKLRVQIGLIRRAFDGQVGIATEKGDDDADAEYLYRPGHVLVGRDGAERLPRFFQERQDTYRGAGDVVGEPVDGLVLYQLPPRLVGGRADVLEALEELDRELGAGTVTPDHVLYVVGKGLGSACPATEPELPPRTGLLPAMAKDPSAGKGVRVSVVDTGWYADAATNTQTPFLAGVDGDLEQVNPAAIHPYAGHGTFVAGIVRCLAPATDIEVEGFLTKGGAIYESEIAQQLNEAMTDRDQPDLISISAGTHARNNLPLIGFTALAARYRVTGRDSPVLVVAAAGNDGTDVPFWPAAFPWVVSVGALDADGTLSDFSNYGTWVDVYAHGRDLVNAFPTGTYTTYEPQTPAGEVRQFTGLAQWSGTSFSTPIVTGAIAAYMSEHGVSARAARDALVAAAPTKNDPKAGTMRTLGPPFV